MKMLTELGNKGMRINPEKFQFYQREVQFSGFKVGEETLKPLDKYINGIRDFPLPQNITDI